MLARVANSLYWTGRYIERSQHLSRYLKVQYFSIFDAPITQEREIVLRSIFYLATDKAAQENFEEQLIAQQEQAQEGKQSQESPKIALSEQEILTIVAFSLENSSSIFSSVKAARENARSIRYMISTELWEAINKYYHYIKDYSVDFCKTRGLYDFTTNVIQQCSSTKSYIDSTLLHDDGWAFLKLGIYLERAAQVLRILNSKIIDIESLSENHEKNPLTAYQWTITLKAFETYDMYRKAYKGGVNQRNVLTFLLSNPSLALSVAFTLEKVNVILSRLTFAVSENSQLSFQAGKLASSFKYLDYDEIKENDIKTFLKTSLEKIYVLNDLIIQEYFE